MSWDLALWKGRPAGSPLEVYRALMDGKRPKLVQPLTVAAVRAAFEAEYLGDLRVFAEENGALEIQGRGFELSLADGALYVYVMCAWVCRKTTTPSPHWSARHAAPDA